MDPIATIIETAIRKFEEWQLKPKFTNNEEENDMLSYTYGTGNYTGGAIIRLHKKNIAAVDDLLKARADVREQKEAIEELQDKIRRMQLDYDLLKDDLDDCINLEKMSIFQLIMRKMRAS